MYGLGQATTHVPGNGVEDGPDVEEGHGGDSSRRQGGGRVELRLCDGDVPGDNVPGESQLQSRLRWIEGEGNAHAESSSNRSNDEDSATTVAINNEECPNESTDGLDDTKDTRGEETSRGTSNPDGPEDGRAVVINGVLKRWKSEFRARSKENTSARNSRYRFRSAR